MSSTGCIDTTTAGTFDVTIIGNLNGGVKTDARKFKVQVFEEEKTELKAVTHNYTLPPELIEFAQKVNQTFSNDQILNFLGLSNQVEN
jgi:hypothetical protein